GDRGPPAGVVAPLPLAVLLRDGHRAPLRAAGRRPVGGRDPGLPRGRLAGLPRASPAGGRHRRLADGVLQRLPHRRVPGPHRRGAGRGAELGGWRARRHRDHSGLIPRVADYRSAGVDLEAAEEAVDRIRPLVAATARPEVVGGIGGFGGVFALDPGRWTAPLLVSTTDGVGTKSEVARLVGRYDTIGLDCVAMSVDDLAVCGAEPLFFLDYVSVGRNDPAMVEALVAGVADGCRQAGCALVGGEISEHAGVMEPGQFDLVGFAVGVVEADRRLPAGVTAGDRIVGVASPGLRSNG